MTTGLVVTAGLSAPVADPEGAQTRRDMLGSLLVEYEAHERQIEKLEAWLAQSDRRIAEGTLWLNANPGHPQYAENKQRWRDWGVKDFLRHCELKDLESKNAWRASRACAVWDRMAEHERAEWFPDATDLPGWAVWQRLRDEAMKDGGPGPDVSF
jgi:hypothetical protein